MPLSRIESATYSRSRQPRWKTASAGVILGGVFAAHHSMVDRKCDWSYIVTMKTIAAGKFKAECLALLDRLGPEGLIVTKHGKPVAHVHAIGHSSATLIGSLAGKVKVEGELFSTGTTWNAAD